MDADLNRVKTVFEILAIICVGGYFCLQVIFGSFVVSMELTPKIECFLINEKQFYHISLTLKRGGYGSVNLHNIYYQVIDLGSERVLIDFKKFTSLDKIDFESFEDTSKNMRMPPGEMLTFSEGFFLENENPIKVDFVVKARKNFGFIVSQWRSNTIFIPENLTNKDRS